MLSLQEFNRATARKGGGSHEASGLQLGGAALQAGLPGPGGRHGGPWLVPAAAADRLGEVVFNTGMTGYEGDPD